MIELSIIDKKSDYDATVPADLEKTKELYLDAIEFMNTVRQEIFKGD